ncbi:hypothetical protein HDV00_004575 [Rhizophlyctis rosea]|nr:hypothetical protein HDV00_004575 [Rhizophlyctis rosea]
MADIDILDVVNEQIPACDLSSLYHAIQPFIPTQKDNYVLRVILIFGRSHVIPSIPSEDTAEFKQIAQNDRTFLDVLYLHDKQDYSQFFASSLHFFLRLFRQSEDNQVQDIYTILSDWIENQSAGWIFELTRATKR